MKPIKLFGSEISMQYYLKSRNLCFNIEKFNNNFRFFGKKEKYSKTNILKNINLDIKEGERVGFIGANGAGKSTLFRLITGIYKETSGTLEKKGNCYGYFGNIFFDENLNGREFLFNSLLLYGLNKEKIKIIIHELINFINIGDYIDKTMNTYSEGMKARLSLSALLFSKPNILLLDEGIGAGDRFFMEKTKNKIDKFILDTPIVLLASHDETLLGQFCDKVCLMNQGEIIEFDRTEKVLNYYKSDKFSKLVNNP